MVEVPTPLYPVTNIPAAIWIAWSDPCLTRGVKGELATGASQCDNVQQFQAALISGTESTASGVPGILDSVASEMDLVSSKSTSSTIPVVTPAGRPLMMRSH